MNVNLVVTDDFLQDPDHVREQVLQNVIWGFESKHR